MATIDQILSSLQGIVNKYAFVAIIWHAIFYFILAALVLKWSPSNRIFGMLLCLPLLSVSVFAWIAGNPFNGSLFAFAAIIVFIFGLKAPDQSMTTSQLIFLASGVLMISFGLVYPHFISPDSIIGYAYASPAGLIPCPTLSILIGFALVFNGFDSKPISLLLIIFGLFYGIFGVLKLKVMIDVALLLGTLMLLVKYFVSAKTV